MKLFLSALALLAATASAECPNGCSGHGSCGIYSDCTCYRNWMGADCSERVCYFGHAFVDTPQGDLNSDGVVQKTSTYKTQFSNSETWEMYDLVSHGKGKGATTAASTADQAAATWDEAHFYRECSNKGVCNRQSGICACFPGYEGEGCTRTACPADCSGHGTCQRLKDQDVLYEAWDAYKTQHCVCDPGYMGPDCSLCECPSGDDPVSRIQVTEVQTFGFAPGWTGTQQSAAAANSIVNFYGAFALKFTDEFGDSWTTTSLSWPSPPFAVSTKQQTADDNLCNGTIVFGSAATDNTVSLVYKNPDKTFANDITTETYAPCSVATSAEVKAALKALPNDVIPDVEVSFAADANPKYGAQGDLTSFASADPSAAGFDAAHAATDARYWAYMITFTGNSGNVADLEVLYEVTHCMGTADTATATPGTCDVAGKTGSSKSVPTAAVYSSATNPFPADIVGTASWGWGGPSGTPKLITESVQGASENLMCSDRGLCDYSTGICKCFQGYTAHDCSEQNSLASA
jgi:hypothetical protein